MQQPSLKSLLEERLVQGLELLQTQPEAIHISSLTPATQAALAARYNVCDRQANVILANSVLTPVADLANDWRSWRQYLQPGGAIFFVMLGRDAWRELNDRVQLDYIDMHEVGDALLQCGFIDPVMDMEMLQLEYDSAKQLQQDLYDCGLENVDLTDLSWPQTFSLEVIYGHAWIATGPVTAALNEQGEAVVPIDMIRRSL